MPTQTSRKRKRSPLLIIAIVVAVLLLLLFVARRLEWIGTKQAIEITLATAAPQTIVERVSASGTVQPVVEVKISPEVPGEIIELNVEEGDSVQQDQLLVRIRPDNFESVLSRTQASLNQQRANLSQMQAAQASSQARLTQAQANYDRNKKLYDDQVISDADFEQTESNYQVALQEVESAKQNVQAARYGIRSAQATVDEARENLSLTSIFAPVSGIVSKLDVEQGERVVGTSQMAGTEMLRIADLNQMEVRVDVNENDIIRVNIGDTAVVDVDAYSYSDKEFAGVVTAIANTANTKVTEEAVTEFEVRIRLLNESYQDLLDEQQSYPFRPGMTASVDIITQRKENVLAVPLSAVTTRPRDSTEQTTAEPTSLADQETTDEVVFRYQSENTVSKVVVETGISDYENIEILSGLSEGDRVVSGPYVAVSRELDDGKEVEEAEQGKDKPKE
ncbi:MAG: efflux RND transporter periplasmic adaptor subunit [Tunicatimonas sp.]